MFIAASRQVVGLRYGCFRRSLTLRARRMSQMGAPRPLVLPADHDVADGAAVLLDEALRQDNAPSTCAALFCEAHPVWLGIPDKEAADPHRSVIDAALVGFDHFHDEPDDGLGLEVLIGTSTSTLRASLRRSLGRSAPVAALFPLRQGEGVREVFDSRPRVNPPGDV